MTRMFSWSGRDRGVEAVLASRGEINFPWRFLFAENLTIMGLFATIDV